MYPATNVMLFLISQVLHKTLHQPQLSFAKVQFGAEDFRALNLFNCGWVLLGSSKECQYRTFVLSQFFKRSSITLIILNGVGSAQCALPWATL